VLKSQIGTGRPSNSPVEADSFASRITRSRRWFLERVVTASAALSAMSFQRATGQNGTDQRGTGPITSDLFKTVYVKLGNNDEGLLYEPSTLGPKARVAVLYSHQDGNNFNKPMGRELASRGYRALAVNHHPSNRRSAGESWDTARFLPGISRGVEYLRTLDGVQRVIVLGHSGGGELIAFYANVALNGPSACQGPEKVYPWKAEGLVGLVKPDGVILLDSTPGSFNRMQSFDPAVNGDSPTRTPSLDMISPANGFDHAAKRANYSPEFVKRYYAAQGAREASLIAHAQERVQALEQGKSLYTDDEVLIIRGARDSDGGARLYNPDTQLLSRTKKPRLLLKADGSEPVVIVPSLRPPVATYTTELGKLETNSMVTTVREFLATSAIRTTSDYNITEDDIVGVDWRSANISTAGNAEGITVPSLVMVMSGHYMIVPGEITFDHLAAKDKTFAAVEGAKHVFTPVKPEYGDTQKRLFDFVDRWIQQPGRFLTT
jgi:pimeloyl-ACP methyl ester carboxylesterase